MKQKKAAVYCRVATVNQVFDSIALQENSLLRFAQEKGYSDCVCYRDNGVSGLSLDRPGMNDLMADISRGMIDTVIIKDSNRVARGLLPFVEWMGFARTHGVNVIAMLEGNMDALLSFHMALMEQYK